MLIDTHAHLTMPEYNNDLDAVLSRATSSGITKIIDVGFDLPASEKAVELTTRYDSLYAAVGIHPHDAKEFNQKVLDRLTELTAHDKVVAIGETGLDYYRNLSPRAKQIYSFRQHIKLAFRSRLPLIVHIRNAYNEALRILKEESNTNQTGVIHCFSGNIEHAKTALELGYFIGFSGSITYNSRRLLKIISELPTDRLLLETDAPFLTPAPFRGKRNEPSFLRIIANKLASALNLSLDDIARITTLNANQLFNLNGYAPPKIVYPIRNSLYLNITNRCTNRCVFCIRNFTNFVKGHNLKLPQEPSATAVIQAIGNPSQYDELVFCGLGEPLLRLDVVKEIALYLKRYDVKIRLNTNGQANLVYGRNIIPELKGLIDEVCISLNAESPEKYMQLSHPFYGYNTYDAIKQFVLECKKHIPKVWVTVVELPEIDITKCREIAEQQLDVNFRIRRYYMKHKPTRTIR